MSHDAHSQLRTALRAHLREAQTAEVDLERDRGFLSELTPHYYMLLSRMADQGEAHRVQNGTYLIELSGERHEVPAIPHLETLVPRLLRGHDYYISWRTALYFHGLIEQQSSTITVAVGKKKRDARFSGYQVKFTPVKPERINNGFSNVRIGRDQIRMASVERALVDSFDRPRLASPFSQVAHALLVAWEDGLLQPDQLVDETLLLGKGSAARRIGFFMDRWSIPGTDQLKSHLGRGYAVPLRPGGDRYEAGGPVNSEWGVTMDPGVIYAAENPK